MQPSPEWSAKPRIFFTGDRRGAKGLIQSYILYIYIDICKHISYVYLMYSTYVNEYTYNVFCMYVCIVNRRFYPIYASCK